MSDKGSRSTTKIVVITLLSVFVLSSCCCAGFLGLGGVKVFETLSQAEPIVKPLELANEHEEIEEHLGHPVDKEGIPQGNININVGKTSVAKYNVRIVGPKGSAKLEVDATQDDDEPWQYHRMRVVTDDGVEMNLLD